MDRRLSVALTSLTLLSLLGPAGSLGARPARAAGLGSLYFQRGAYIYVANADGSNVRQFSSTGAPGSPDGYPAVSYDGKSVAYANPSGKIYVVSLASGRVRAITAPRGVRDLAWSPGGLVLAFDAPNGPGGMSAIGNVPSDGSDPGFMWPEQHPRAHPSWGDDFTIVASEYRNTPARWDIINLSYRPGDEDVDKNVFDSPKADYHDFATAYDGKTFGLIVTARGATRGDLDVSPLGGNYVKIAHKVPLRAFCFSPDSSMVAFVKGGALYTAPANGGATPRLVLSNAIEPAWGPLNTNTSASTSASTGTSGMAPTGSQSAISIQDVALVHVVNGNLKATTVVASGEAVAVVVGYKAAHATGARRGKIVFDTGGQAVKTVSLTPHTLSDGTPYFMWVGALTQPGSYTAAITVRVGSAATHTSLSFTVR